MAVPSLSPGNPAATFTALAQWQEALDRVIGLAEGLDARLSAEAATRQVAVAEEARARTRAVAAESASRQAGQSGEAQARALAIAGATRPLIARLDRLDGALLQTSEAWASVDRLQTEIWGLATALPALGLSDAQMRQAIGDLERLQGALGAAVARVESRFVRTPDTNDVPAASRPGESPRLWTAQIDLPPARAVAATAGRPVADANGAVLRFTGAGRVGPLNACRVETGRVYQVRFVVQRRLDPTDPANDAVRLGLRPLSAGMGAIGANATVADLDGLTVADGRTMRSALVLAYLDVRHTTGTPPQDAPPPGRAWLTVAGRSVTDPQGAPIHVPKEFGAPIVLPQGSVYCRPYVELFGTDGETDVEIVEWTDVTAAGGTAPDLAIYESRIGALEETAPGPRLDTIEAQLGGAAINDYPTRASVASWAIAATVQVIRVLAFDGTGPLCPALYRRAASEPDHAGTIRSADGAWWALSPAQRVTVEMFGARGDGVTDDTAAIQAANDFFEPAARRAPTSRAEAMAGGGTLHFAAAWYRTTNTLYKGAYVRWVGAGRVFFPQQNAAGGDYFACYRPGVSPPNGTIIVADFPARIRGFAPIVHTTPWVLGPLAGQTIGTRYRATAETGGANWAPGVSIDAGLTSYCEGSTEEGLTLFAVNRTFAGLRKTNAPSSRIADVACINVEHGFIGESCWESRFDGLCASTFTGCGYRGEGNHHGCHGRNWWMHGGQETAGRNVGLYLSYAGGFSCDGVSFDNLALCVQVVNSTGITISGIHCEYPREAVAKLNNAFGVELYGDGFGPTAPNATGTDGSRAVLVEGGDFACVFGVAMDHPFYGAQSTGSTVAGSKTVALSDLTGFTRGTIVRGPGVPEGTIVESLLVTGRGPSGTLTLSAPATATGTGVTLFGQGSFFGGRSYRTDTNPFTGERYDFGWPNHKDLTFLRRAPAPEEVGLRVPLASGRIQFIDGDTRHIVVPANGALHDQLDLLDAGGSLFEDLLFAGQPKFYRWRSPTQDVVFRKGSNDPLLGWRIVGDSVHVVVGRRAIIGVNGSPEGVHVADPGTLAQDETGHLWIKTGGIGTNTGWAALALQAPPDDEGRRVLAAGDSAIRQTYGTPETFVTGRMGDLVLDNANGWAWIKRGGAGRTGWQRLLGAAADLVDAGDDAAAAAAGVPVGEVYRTGSLLKLRVS